MGMTTDNRLADQERRRLAREERFAKARAKLAEEERKHAERLRAARTKLTQTRRESRDLDKDARAARRRRTGLYADEAGLFVWDEGTVAQLFTLLAERLAHVPDPVAVLEALLSDPVTMEAD